MKKQEKYVIKLTIEDLEKLYRPLPKNEKEKEWEWFHRMGRNNLVIELIDKLVHQK